MKEKLKLLPGIVFILCIYSLCALFYFNPKQEYSELEKRKLQTLPKLKASTFLSEKFQNEYENYLSDHFPKRELFVNLKSRTDILLGKRDINDVYVGKDDYIIEKFSDDDFKEELVDDNAWYMVNLLCAMQDKYGEGHVNCILIPAKDRVMKDRLPSYAKPYDTSYVYSLFEKYEQEFGTKLKCIYDFSDILYAHKNENIYYKTDHHWTTLGAYYAYEEYKKLQGETAPPWSDYDKKVVSKDFYGTSYNKLQIKLSPDEIIKATLKGAKEPLSVSNGIGKEEKAMEGLYVTSELETADKYNYFLGGNYDLVHIKTGVENEKTLLLIKDSFSNSFVPFLTQDYGHIYMLDPRYMSVKMKNYLKGIELENEITDVLVMMNMQKFMQNKDMWRTEE